MAIKNVTFQRTVAESKLFQEPDIAALQAAFDVFAATKFSDTTKTFSIRIVNTFWDGVNFIMCVEASYPEINEDPTGQVPEPV